jgi:hypothetical protein
LGPSLTLYPQVFKSRLLNQGRVPSLALLILPVICGNGKGYAPSTKVSRHECYELLPVRTSSPVSIFFINRVITGQAVVFAVYERVRKLIEGVKLTDVDETYSE